MNKRSVWRVKWRFEWSSEWKVKWRSNENYTVITTWFQSFKSFSFSRAKILISCIIFIIISPRSHAYTHIMILVKLTSTYDFDYDFDMRWYRLTLSWYDIILRYLWPSFPLYLHKRPILIMYIQSSNLGRGPSELDG